MCSKRCDDQNSTADPHILTNNIDSPFSEGNLPNPKLLGGCYHISLSLSALSLICHLSALFSTPEETKPLRHNETKPTKPSKLLSHQTTIAYYILGYWSGKSGVLLPPQAPGVRTLYATLDCRLTCSGIMPHRDVRPCQLRLGLSTYATTTTTSTTASQRPQKRNGTGN